jgi:integrase
MSQAVEMQSTAVMLVSRQLTLNLISSDPQDGLGGSSSMPVRHLGISCSVKGFSLCIYLAFGIRQPSSPRLSFSLTLSDKGSLKLNKCSHNRIMLPQIKNGQARIVYLNSLAQQAINAVQETTATPTDRVFGQSQMVPDYVSQVFARACRISGVEDFSFHDLRHTAASWMRMHGADIHTVAQILGHKDLRMAARYQRRSPAFLSDAVKSLGSTFEAPQIWLEN